MWHIENPKKVFNYVIEQHYEEEKELNVFLILKKEKYESFSIEDRELVEHNPKLMIENIRIKNILS